MKAQELEEHKNEVTTLLHQYLDEGSWIKAQKLLENELKSFPNDFWILTNLSEIYYEQHHYDDALKFAEQALKVNNDNPLVLHNYASILDMKGETQRSIDIWLDLLNKGISYILKECGESKRWAESLLNDVRARLALSYSDLDNFNDALKYLKNHLDNRKRGLPSNFTKKYILRKIKEFEKAS
ncbi:MAG TPA: hypothetical protein DCS93_05115 [Microscillaceae bacterium]|nr:hypothetical protein [Microscillaceae bacterium]